MNIPTIALQDISPYSLHSDVELAPLMKDWDAKIKIHLTNNKVIEALKHGFKDHFFDDGEWENYPWDNPRLDLFTIRNH